MEQILGEAIGQMLASAVGIAISPVPLIAMVLMLATPRGRSNGVAFTLSWVGALAVVVAAVVLIGSGANASSGSNGAPATWTSWVKLVFGVLFVLMAVKQWTGRPREGQEDGATPRWMRAIDTFTPVKAAGLAAALAVANPKNLVLAIGGALSIAGSDASAGGKTTAAILMVLIGSLAVLAPFTVFLAGGAASARVLERWKSAMARHNAAIMITVLTVLGSKYIGDAISTLTA
ncbi:GAP family protein [Streptomyces murinus]|uniref:GAP family protein n=1 Tax=Streptomyces murinus TaxID=33900 RepID=UPI00381BB7F2